MFDALKKKTVEQLIEEALYRETEEQLFAQVVEEIEAGKRRDGLWAKALISAEGDETKAKIEYIQLRVQSILDEEMLGSLRKAEADKKAADAAQKKKEAKAEKERKEKDFWNVASMAEIRRKFAEIGVHLDETEQGWVATYPNGEKRETIWRSGLKKLFAEGSA